MLEIIDTLIQFRKFKLYPVDLDSILAKVLGPMVAMGSVTTSQADYSSPHHVNTSSELHERSRGVRRVSRDQPQQSTMISQNGREVQGSKSTNTGQGDEISDLDYGDYTPRQDITSQGQYHNNTDHMESDTSRDRIDMSAAFQSNSSSQHRPHTYTEDHELGQHDRMKIEEDIMDIDSDKEDGEL